MNYNEIPVGTVLISAACVDFVYLLITRKGTTLTWLDLLNGRMFMWDMKRAECLIQHTVILPAEGT